MEINYEPKFKKDLHKKRMYFLDKMVWTERELGVEKKQLYNKSTGFILTLQYNSKIVKRLWYFRIFSHISLN